MKLDQAAIDAAMATDVCIKRLDDEAAACKVKEKARLAEVQARITVMKAELATLTEQARELNKELWRKKSDIKRQQEQALARWDEVKALERRRAHRVKAILRKMEEAHINEQRLAFRKASLTLTPSYNVIETPATPPTKPPL